MEITLYTRTNCSLCDKAKEAIARAGLTAREVDIDGDAELYRRFTNEVPVVSMDGSTEGWQVAAGHHLVREVRFPDFAQALAFVNRVGAVAEAMNHHPEIELGWGRVRLSIWTHTKNGLTKKDFELARRIDAS
jgi:pterin-4a-carbinolamine dehydratase